MSKPCVRCGREAQGHILSDVFMYPYPLCLNCSSLLTPNENYTYIPDSHINEKHLDVLRLYLLGINHDLNGLRLVVGTLHELFTLCDAQPAKLPFLRPGSSINEHEYRKQESLDFLSHLHNIAKKKWGLPMKIEELEWVMANWAHLSKEEQEALEALQVPEWYAKGFVSMRVCDLVTTLEKVREIHDHHHQ